MSGILRSGNSDRVESSGRNDSVFIKDIHYTNSSAKFWYGLLEETAQDFPECTGIELSSSASDRLNADLLFPETSLARDLERLMFADIQSEMKKTIAELEMFGPPPAVHIRLISDASEMMSRDLPLDIIDSEIFSCLIVWPLKWAGIPESRWNERILEGSVCFEERKQGKAYEMSFTLEKQPLSEGLFRRYFSIKHSRKSHSCTAKTAAP